jgi:predicted nucleic acid-binding Zn ribbon protein
MPIYVYHCPDNQQTLEVLHSMHQTIATWGELCQMAKSDPGVTAPEAPVKRLITAPQISVPQSNSDYKSQGFKKLVRRERGVYENVTASDGEARILRA